MPDVLRVLIADDERPARQKIRRFVEHETGVHIYEAADGERALQVIRSESPDVIFLDIQMPGVTGIEVVEAMSRDAMGRIVFVTAHDEYAVRAFDLHAVDYLLKPFNQERFTRAWHRARTALDAEQQELRAQRLYRVLAQLDGTKRDRMRRVLVEENGRTLLVDLAEVCRIESARNYLILHTNNGRHRLRGTITNFERRVDPAQMVRVNRSAMVNVNNIVELQSVGHGDHDIRLRDGSVVRLSRKYKECLTHWM